MATKPMRGPAGRAMHATERPKNTGKTMRRTMAFILKPSGGTLPCVNLHRPDGAGPAEWHAVPAEAR